MKRRLVFISSMLLTLATSTIAFATVADAAVVRHHFVHLTVAHGGHAHAAHGRHAGHGGWVGRDWTGDNWGSNYGRMDSDYNGYGSYHGYAGFLTFSHRMAVFRQSRLSTFALLRPPYRGFAERLTKFLTR